MRYSYIKPREKTALSSDMQLLFTFFLVSLFMLFITYAFLLFRDYRFSKDREDIAKQIQEVQINTASMK